MNVWFFRISFSLLDSIYVLLPLTSDFSIHKKDFLEKGFYVIDESQ